MGERRPLLTGTTLTVYSSSSQTTEALVALRESLVDRINFRIASLNRTRNQGLPISRLPAELFHEILLFCFDENDPATTERLKVLASVSHYWLFHVRQTPRLWSWIDFGAGLDDIQLHLKRSGSTLLQIAYEYELTSGQDELERFADKIRESGVISNSDRWHSVYLVGLPMGAIDPSTIAILAQPLPNLTEVVLNTETFDNETTQGFTFVGGPRLKQAKLAVAHAPLRMTASVFFTLETLRIDWTHVDGLEELLQILQQNPRLKKITLQYVTGAFHNEERSKTVISLPHLEHLELCQLQGETPADIYVHILERVSAPQLRELNYRVARSHSRSLPAGAEQHLDNIFAALLYPKQEHPPSGVLSNDEEWVGGQILEIDAVSPLHKLDISSRRESVGYLGGPQVTRAFNRIPFPPPSPFHTQRFRIQLRVTGVADFIAIMRCFPGTTFLSLDCEDQGAVEMEVIRALSHPHGATNLYWLCPSLSSLHFVTNCSSTQRYEAIMAELREMRQSRKASLNPLHELEITCSNDAMVIDEGLVD